MADQETVRTYDGNAANGAVSAREGSNGKRASSERSSRAGTLDSSSSGVVTNVAGFGEDLLTLAELQTRLTAIELRQNLESARNSGILIVIGSIAAVSALPVLLVGVAELLVSEMGMKRGFALLIAGGMAIAITGACFATARLWLRAKPLGLPLAGEEFARNVNWLRTILRQSGRWSPRR